MVGVFIKPDDAYSAANPESADYTEHDGIWRPGMMVEAYEDDNFNDVPALNHRRFFYIRIPGVTRAAAKTYLKNNARDLTEVVQIYRGDDPDGNPIYSFGRRRAVRLVWSGVPQGPKDAYQAGQRDFTFTKEQVLAYLERFE